MKKFLIQMKGKTYETATKESVKCLKSLQKQSYKDF